MYHDKSTSVREGQPSGWESHIRGWCERSKFVEVLPTLRGGLEGGFVDLLHKTVVKGMGPR
jgi:hypothetical protein